MADLLSHSVYSHHEMREETVAFEWSLEYSVNVISKTEFLQMVFQLLEDNHLLTKFEFGIFREPTVLFQNFHTTSMFNVRQYWYMK